MDEFRIFLARGGRQFSSAPLSVLCLLFLTIPVTGFTQATSPITSSGLSTTVTKSGNAYDITGGTRPGSGPNLFHSFGEFGVPANHTANFLNESGLATSNILGRVTGGNPSNIFGTVQTTGFGSANLFLMNPAGIVFGPNASLNVGGSVSFTTADYLRLADGARFNALPGVQDAAISSAPVAAFGFLGSNPGAITVQGSQLSVTYGQSIALVGGDITVQSGTLGNGVTQSARVSAPSGHIQMASTASPGELLTGTLNVSPNVNGQSFGTLGTIDISQQSRLDVSGDHGGTISIRGGQFVLNDAVLAANATGTDFHGGNGSSSPAEITLTADAVTLNNGSYITTDTYGPAPAGHITFNVNALTTDGAGPIRLHASPESFISNPIISETGVLIETTSRSTNAGAGAGGQIIIQGIKGEGSVAQHVNLTDTILHARTFGGTAETRPSSLSITTDTVALSDQVILYTTSNGATPAGNVDLHVNTLRSNMNADGTFIDGRPVLIGGPTELEDTSAGPPGIVTISGPGSGTTDPARLIMLGNTEIDTFASGGSSSKPAPIIMTGDTVSLNNLTILVTTSGATAPAPAGDIVINANTLRINVHPDESPIANANRVYLNSPSGRLDETAGPPGTVTISGIGPELTDAAHLVSLYNAQMSTAVEGGTQALSPGTITITADTMVMSGRTSIFAFSTSPAPAGNIALNVNTLRSNVNPDGTPLNDGQPPSLIASVGAGTESGSGRGGTVTISGVTSGSTDPAKLIALNNTEVSTAVFGGTAGTRPASITMTADTINVTNSPKINTDSAGGAPAGQIALTAKNLTIDHGTVSTSSSGRGSGGPIAITGIEGVFVKNGSTITASSSGQGNAGNITIHAGTQFLSHNSAITTEAAQASGGSIFIRATDSIRLINSQLNTSVQGGPNTSGGNITLDPAVVTLQNSQVRADAVQGNGGNINIIAGTFLFDPTSVVSASSQFGLSGSVNIQSPLSNLSSTMATLPQQPLQSQLLLRQRCAAQSNGLLSSLVMSGRDALPTEPGGWLMSPLASSSEFSVPGTQSPLAGDPVKLSETSEAWKGERSDQHSAATRHGQRDSKTGCGS